MEVKEKEKEREKKSEIKKNTKESLPLSKKNAKYSSVLEIG